LRTMSRRIDIELTSVQPDGSWTWRAAGAKVPKGVLDATLLPVGSKVGDQLKVEVIQEIDGITVTAVIHGRQKVERDNLLELVTDDKSFEPVTQQLVKKQRGDREGGGRPRRDGDSRPRRDADSRPRRDGDSRPRRDGDAGRGADGQRRDRRPGSEGRNERSRPSFTPPPEVPQRPKAKRLRPGKTHRTEVLAGLPEEQRPIAELAIQGMSAVRQRLREDNQKLEAEGKATMPEASVLKMAEELLPRLRLAEWMDRAEAAQRQMQLLDLRDLRSVVAAAEDPTVARDERARAISAELKTALAAKQQEELDLWYADIDAALAVGRVIRALRLSSQPPKAGVPFPGDVAQRLAAGANAALAPADGAERWIGVLEAAAFSPIRSMITTPSLPDPVSEELRATVTRLAKALPQVAAVFGIEVPTGAAMPKPLRPTSKAKPARASGRGETPIGGAKDAPKASGGDSTAPRQIPAPPSAQPAAPAAETAPVETEPVVTAPVETAPPGTETATGETATGETATVETETATGETATVETETATGETATVETETATVETETAAVETETAAVETETAPPGTETATGETATGETAEGQPVEQR
jgi:hypothetical protein